MDSLVGRSPQICEIRRLVEKLARSRAPVLLLGESGTGKEVLARAIHQSSGRGEFVPIDCGALVGPLMETELFGHTRGAFTGAAEAKKGLVELADAGTAFFDEIGDLRLDMQVKLLRLLQEREFRPVGSLHWRKLDIRVMAATHRHLAQEVASGNFRQDLYYRLKVITLRLPPLRERKQDIPLLLDHFLAQRGIQLSFTKAAMEAMLSYDWPGNVRELQNCVDSAAAFHSGPVLDVPDLPSTVQAHLAYPRVGDSIPSRDGGDAPVIARPASPPLPLPETEKRSIIEALAFTRGDRLKAAQLLGIGRTTLYRKLKEYRIPH